MSFSYVIQFRSFQLVDTMNTLLKVRVFYTKEMFFLRIEMYQNRLMQQIFIYELKKWGYKKRRR